VSFFKEVFFCGQCKKVFEELDHLLFVENHGQVGFCSESCIEKFYEPLVFHYEEQEKIWRSENNLLDEEVLEIVGQPSFMDKLLGKPDEVYVHQGRGGVQIYSFIRHMSDSRYGDFSLACLCLTYEKRPSFIISVTSSSEERMIENYRWGEKVEDVTVFYAKKEESEGIEQVHLDEQTMMFVENKKSELLAKMIGERKSADIEIENFPLYEQYFEITMMNPDEIYCYEDEFGDVLYSYIKAHDREGVSFYYLVLCYQIEKKYKAQKETLIPVLSFPTVDGEIYNHYRRGKFISGNLKN